MAVAHSQGAQQCSSGQCVETYPGNAFARALRRRSSLEWNNHSALLASCIASRKDRIAAMRIVETGSDRQDFFDTFFFEAFAFFFAAFFFLATFFFGAAL